MRKAIRDYLLGIRCTTAVAMLTLLSAVVPQMVLAASEATEASTAPFEQRFEFALGSFFPYIDSTVSLGPTGGGEYFKLALESTGSQVTAFDFQFFGPAIFGYANF